MAKYIDVSSHQGTIDFNKLKGNVDGVIIRAGYGQTNIDSQFKRNASECNRLGIPCGAYWFSYAYNTTMAQNEAKKFISVIKDYKMDLPLAFDYEYDSVNYATKNGVNVTVTLVKNMTNTFCQYVEKQGYYCMLYANPDFINKYFGDLTDRYDLWLAQWPKTVDVNKPPRKCGIWQWGTSNVPGINGGVDSNESYKDYTTYLRSIGSNHLNNKTATQQTVINTKPTSTSTAIDYMKWARDMGLHNSTNSSASVSYSELSKILYNFYQKIQK